jgi:hypothetical protein
MVPSPRSSQAFFLGFFAALLVLTIPEAAPMARPILLGTDAPTAGPTPITLSGPAKVGTEVQSRGAPGLIAAPQADPADLSGAPDAPTRLSLRDVLHRFVNEHRAPSARSPRDGHAEHPDVANGNGNHNRNSNTNNDDDDDVADNVADDPLKAVRQYVLDSEILAIALTAVATPQAANDGTKRVMLFGGGELVFDLGSDTGRLAVREAATGGAFQTTGGGESSEERARARAREEHHAIRLLINKIRAFLVSDEGIALTVLVGMLAALTFSLRLTRFLVRRNRLRRLSPLTLRDRAIVTRRDTVDLTRAAPARLPPE